MIRHEISYYPRIRSQKIVHLLGELMEELIGSHVSSFRSFAISWRVLLVLLVSEGLFDRASKT